MYEQDYADLHRGEEYTWGLREGSSNDALVRPMYTVQVGKGVVFRDLFPEDPAPERGHQPEPDPKKYEGRVIPLADIPAIIVLTERAAVVCFRFIGGRMDYAGFFGKDPTSLKWVKDLFLYYWDKGKRK